MLDDYRRKLNPQEGKGFFSAFKSRIVFEIEDGNTSCHGPCSFTDYLRMVKISWIENYLIVRRS